MTQSGKRRLVAIVVLGVWLLTASAQAQDLETQLAEAQGEVADAQDDVAAAEQQLAEAADNLGPIARKAGRASRDAAAAAAEVRAIQRDLVEERIEAAREISSLESGYEEQKRDHDDERGGDVGFGVGAGLLALIPFLWTRFRSSPPVRWLASRSLGRAAGVVCGSVLGGLVLGGLLIGSAGTALTVGAFLITISMGLVVALLLARHSLRVERGEGQPVISRERLPRWVSSILAVVLALLFVGSLGSGLVSDEPAEPEISAELRQLAADAKGNPAEPPSDELADVQTIAEPVIVKAEQLEAVRDEAEDAVHQAKSNLMAAKNRLKQGQAEVTQLTNRIAREAEQAAEEAAAAPTPSSGGEGDGASYSSCATAPSNIPVPPGSPLDGDGDGIGCES